MKIFFKKLMKWDTELSYTEAFLFFCLIRISCVFLNQTWFVADEFWQSQEVAHHITFGYGYLTWEWREGIRGYLYPLAIAFFYKLLEIIHLDKTIAFLYIVPAVHAIWSACADLFFFTFTKQFYGSQIAYRASMLRTISWFTIYMSTRSLTNNMEEIFTIFCLARLINVPSEAAKSSKDSFWLLHICGFVSFAIRATAAINLIPIYVYQFFFLCQTYQSKFRLFWQFILTGFVVLGLNVLIDSYFHGGLLISSFNFLLYNVFHNVGVHYGTHPFHWYLSQGLPIILFTHMFVFLIGIKHTKKLQFPLLAILFNVFIYSLLSHKEFRFLNQTMPFGMIVCAYGLVHIEFHYGKKVNRFILQFLAISNLAMILAVGLFHQRGPISLMRHLRNEKVLKANDSVLFLIPCHSTPYYSYLHRNITMRFLTCEPNIDRSIEFYEDEADRFDTNPEGWFQQNREELDAFTHVVIFDNVYARLKKKFCARFLKKPQASFPETKVFLDRFDEQEVFYHTFFEESERRGKNLVLLTRKIESIEADIEVKEKAEEILSQDKVEL